jgi:DNA-binding transcriptional ArsR family regulator
VPTDEPIPPEFVLMMAERFALLGDPTRLAIVYCLMKHGERNVTHIVEATGQSHPNVSKHLRHLREAKVVSRRRDGQQIFYRIADPLVEQLCRLVCEALLATFREGAGGSDAC